MEFKHVSVLLEETIQGLNIKSDGIYVDGTLGGAGHSSYICERIYPNGVLVGIDQDNEAISAAKIRLQKYENNVIYVNNNFVNIKDILSEINIDGIDGMMMDLGVSSYQLDNPERGFSYQFDNKLDMRMNSNNNLTAYDVVNEYSEENLKKIIRDYGEELWAARIAKFIVDYRKKDTIKTTGELVEIIKHAVPAKARREGPHPAKRTFQAIRIEVNNELGILEKAINDSVDLLKPNGRLAIITFHSLEDRIVKNTYKKLADPCECPSSFPQCICGKKPKIKIVSRKPIIPTSEEILNNPRSRSAKLRIAEKLV